MTLSEILFGTGLVGGAIFVTWLYTVTERGRSLGRDIQKANRRSRWWMRRAFLARHWPVLVLIAAFTLGFAVVATQWQ